MKARDTATARFQTVNDNVSHNLSPLQKGYITAE